MNPTVYYIPRQSDFCLLTGAAGCHSSFVTPAGCVHMCLHVPDTESQTLSPPSVPPVATQGCVAQNPTASTDPCNEGVAATGPKPQKRGYAVVVVVVIVVALVVVVVSRTLGVFIRAPIASHPIPSHPITSHHIPSHPITSHHIKSRHVTSHHTTSHHTTSHHIARRVELRYIGVALSSANTHLGQTDHADHDLSIYCRSSSSPPAVVRTLCRICLQ